MDVYPILTGLCQWPESANIEARVLYMQVNRLLKVRKPVDARRLPIGHTN